MDGSIFHGVNEPRRVLSPINSRHADECPASYRPSTSQTCNHRLQIVVMVMREIYSHGKKYFLAI